MNQKNLKKNTKSAPTHPCPRFFGLQVKFHRKKMNMTQKNLSEASGVKMRHIQKIEAGEVDVRLSTIGAISQALDIAPSTLLYPAKTNIPMMCESCVDRNELLIKPR